MRTKNLLATTALLAPGGLLAHGPHAEVAGTGLPETLLHLLAHAWPVVPVAIIGYYLYRRLRSTA